MALLGPYATEAEATAVCGMNCEDVPSSLSFSASCPDGFSTGSGSFISVDGSHWSDTVSVGCGTIPKPTRYTVTMICTEGDFTYVVDEAGASYTGSVTILSASPFHAQFSYLASISGSCCEGGTVTVDITE